MLRGKESSNRIELSQLVQDLLNFGVLGSLQLWGGGRWMGGIWGHGRGGVLTHRHMHMHACTHTHTHLYMYRNCKWPLTWRHPCLACLTCMCMCACACVCLCVCMGHFPIHPYPLPLLSAHPPPPRGVDNWNHLKFDNTSTYQDISISFEDLKTVRIFHPWVGVWFGGWVVGWVF